MYIYIFIPLGFNILTKITGRFIKNYFDQNYYVALNAYWLRVGDHFYKK